MANEISSDWGGSGWGGRTRKDGYRRNPATRFIADGDESRFPILDSEGEIRRSLGIGGPQDASYPTADDDASIPLNGSPGGQAPPERLESLDVFRGVTVLLMIFVNNLGEAWPEMQPSSWDGLHLADVVTPFFIWMVGFSVPIALRRQLERRATIGMMVTKVAVRTGKLFLLGLVLNGGGLPEYCGTELCVGYNFATIRIPGVLQRIAIAYFTVGMGTLSSMLTAEPVLKAFEQRVAERWDKPSPDDATGQDRMRALLGNREVGSTIGVGMSRDTGDAGPTCVQQLCEYMTQYRRFVLLWVFSGSVVAIYSCLTLFTAVGSYDNPSGQVVSCVVDGRLLRGARSPACNSVGYYDRLILGTSHMSRHNDTFARLPDCSTGTPPSWCSVPFDSDGIVSTICSITTCFFGAYCCQVLMGIGVAEGGVVARLKQWLPLSCLLIASGLVLHVTSAIPFNRNLWSLSYLCLTAGISSGAYAFLHATVDAPAVAKQGGSTVFGAILSPLSWLGSNSILFYVLHTLHPHILTCFYYGSLRNNLYTAQERTWAGILNVDECRSNKGCTMALAVSRCVIFLILAVFLRKIRIRLII